MNKLKDLLLAILSSVLLVIAWPPNGYNFIIFLAFVPVVYVSFKLKRTYKAFLYFYLSYFLFLLFKNIPLFLEGFNIKAMVVGLIFLPLLSSIPLIISHSLIKKIGLVSSLFLFVILFSAYEISQFYLEVSFIWYNLGFTLGDKEWANPLYQIIGIKGIGVLIISINVAFAYLLIFRNTYKKKVFYTLSILVILLLVPYAINTEYVDKSKKQSFTIHSFSPSTKEVNKVSNNLRGQIDLLISNLKTSNLAEVDLIVGPEAFLDDLPNNPLFINKLDSLRPIIELKKLSTFFDKPVILGAILVELIDSNEFPSSTAKFRKQGSYYEVYNASLLINRNSKIEWRSKEKLVPISEFVPFHEFINSSYSPFQRMDKSFKKLNNQKPYKVNNLKIKTSICYEAFYPDNAIEESNLHLVLSNDWSVNENVIEQNYSYYKCIVKETNTPILLATMDKKSKIFQSDSNSNFLFQLKSF